MPLFRITLGLFCLLTAVEAAAQGDFRLKLDDSAFVARRRFKAIRITHQDLRSYGAKKPDKRWKFLAEYQFGPDGRLKSYRDAEGSGQPFGRLHDYTTSKELDSLGRPRREIFRNREQVVYDDHYEYDAQGRLRRVLRGGGPDQPAKPYRVVYYDDSGREIGQVFYKSYFDSGNGPGELRKFYDAKGLLWASEFRSAREEFPGHLDSLYYDAQGREIAESHYLLPYNGFPLSLSRGSRRSYRPDGKVAWIRYWGNNPRHSGQLSTFTYDAAGNELSFIREEFNRYVSAGRDQGYRRFHQKFWRYNDHGDLVEEREEYRHEEPPGQVLGEGLQEVTRWKIEYYQ